MTDDIGLPSAVGKRVAIVQEYVPRYRIEFFAGLVELLADWGIECVVVAGLPAGSQLARGDAAESTPWLRLVNPRRLTVGSQSLFFYGTDTHWRDCDGVVMELRGNSFDLHLELLRKRRSGRRVGVWGHVKPFIRVGHPLDLAIERRQMKRSDRVFAYTTAGVEFATSAGVDPAKITNVMNSTDVSDLVEAVRAVGKDEILEFRNRYDLVPGKTFGYIGGLDSAKRIDFLAKVLDEVWRKDPEIKLVVGGRGDQERALDAARIRGQVIKRGYVDARGKALIALVSEALVNPGRVGLLAVECLAIGLPILTTDWRFHAPEFDYLVRNDDVYLSRNDPHAFAELMLSRTGRSGTVEPKDYPTVTDMIRNFAEGIMVMME